jgi:hypothetical protein
MATTVQLPNDETATLRDSEELTNREVKNLRKSARVASAIALRLVTLGFKQDDETTWNLAAQLSDADDETLDLFQRSCLVMRLLSWTCKLADGSDRPMPTNADEVDDLPRPIFVPLTTAAANISFTDDFEVSPDPKAPTAN